MEAADLFMYGTGIFSDGESESEYTEASASVSAVSASTKETPRKFGTELHKSLGNRSSQSSAKKAHPSSRFASKQVSTTQKRSHTPNRKLSPHYENGATPKPIKSRFNSRTNIPVVKRKLEGSLQLAEQSIKSALTVKPKFNVDDSDISRGSDVVQRTRFARAKTPKQSPKRSEYTVNFEPGSIGLKLEPVLKNGQKEFGCRVMKLMTNGKGSNSPSQAVKSGKINIGDVLTAVNGKNVTSKSYKEIVSMLTSSGKRGVTFRIPSLRSPAPVMPITPATTIRSSLEDAATGNRRSQHEEGMPKTPVQPKNPSIDGSTAIFSPSFVKKMTRSTVKDASIFYTPRHETKPLSNVLSTVMKSVAPSISTAKPSVLSKQISNIFAGNSSKEADETIHMKMELLNELSQAKASLGDQEKNMIMMTKIMENIHREKVVVQSEKIILEDELSEAQKAKAVSESMLHEKDEAVKIVEAEKAIELERAQSNLDETTSRVNALAKQNGLLRAQYEHLKVQFNGKERDFSRQLAKATKEAKDAEDVKKKAVSLEKKLAEKERKLHLVSKELTDRTSFAEKAANGMNEKDTVLSQIRSTVEKMTSDTEKMETSHQVTVSTLESKLFGMVEDFNAQTAESEQIHEENTRTNSMLGEASLQIEELSKKMKEEREQHEEDMHTITDEHKEQLEDEKEKLEKALIQLSDSKQIIESTTSELHNKLFAVQAEFDKKRQSEKQLLLQMSERERDLRRENEKNHQNLKEAASNKSIIDNNFQQIQLCLSDKTKKVETLEADLGRSQQKNLDLASEKEEISMIHEETELKYQDLFAANAQNTSRQEALMTESQELRLALSELKRSADSNEQHLAKQIHQQKADFDVKLSGFKISAESKEQHLITQIHQHEAKFDHEKLKLGEQIADSKAFIQNLMNQLETGSNESSEVYKQKVAKLECDLTETGEIVQKLKQDKEQITDSLQLCVEEKDALACDNKKLATRLESSEENTKRWMQTSRVVSSDLSQLKQSLQTEKEGYESKFNEHQDAIEHLILERDAFKSELQDLSDTSSAEKQGLEASLRRTEDDLALTKSAIEEQASNSSLMMQVIELEDKVRHTKGEAERQMEILQEELTKQSDTFGVKISNLQTSFSESVREKEDFIENLLSEIEEKQSAIQGLANAKGEISSKCQELEKDKSRKEDKVSSLTKELEALKEHLATSHDELALSTDSNEQIVNDLKNQLARAQKDIKIQKERTDDFLSENSKNAQIRIEQIHANFKESVVEKEQFIEKLQQEIEDKQDSIASLDLDYQNASERVEKLEAELCEVHSQFKGVQKDLDESTADSAKQSDLVRAVQNSHQSKNEQMQQLFRESVAEKEQFIETLQQEIEDKQDSIDHLALDRQDAIESVETLETELCEVQSQCNELQKDLNKTKVDATIQLDLVRAVQDSHQSKDRQMQELFDSSVAEKEALIYELQEVVEKKQDSIDALMHDQQVVQSTKEDMDIKLRSLEAQHRSKQEELLNTKNLAETRIKELQENLTTTVAKMQKEISDTKKDHLLALKEATCTASILTEEVDNLQSTRIELMEKERIAKCTLEDTKLQFQQLQDSRLKTDKEQQALVHKLEAESKKLELQLEDHTRKANFDLMQHRTLFENSQKINADTIAEKEEAVTKLTKDVEEKTKTLDSLVNSYEKVVSESTSMSDQITDLENSAKETVHKLHQEMEKSQESTEIISSLKDSIVANEAETVSLQIEARRLLVNLASEKEELQFLREKSEQAEESLVLAQSAHDCEIATLKDSQLQERTELSQNLDVAHDSVTKCREELYAVQNNLLEKDDHTEKMKIEAMHKDSQISLLTRQREVEVMKFQDLSSSLRKDVDDKSTVNEKLDEKVQALQESIESSKRCCSNLETELRNARNEASSKNNSANRLLADLVNTCKSLKLKDEEYVAVSDSSVDSSRELIRCLREAVKNERSNAVAGLELANSRERAVFRLERTLSSKERDIKSLHKDVDKFKASIVDLKNRQFLTKERNTDLEIKIKSIEYEKVTAEHKCAVSDKLANSLCQEKSELKTQVSKSAVELEGLQKSMTVAQTAVIEYELKLMILGVANEQASEQASLIKTLQSDLEDVATEMEHMMQQNESLEKQVENLQEKLEISESHAKSVHQKCVQLDEKLAEKLTETSELEDKNSSLYNQNLSLLETIEGCNKAIGELKQELSTAEERNLVERSNFESRIQSQKRIATILEKHLSERSAELNSLRQASASDARKLQMELTENKSLVHALRLDLDEAQLMLLCASDEKERLENELKNTQASANVTTNALRVELDETHSKLMLASKEKERLENELKETEAGADVMTNALRVDLDEACSKFMLASKEKERLENELKNNEVGANVTTNALRVELIEVQSMLMLASKEKERLENTENAAANALCSELDEVQSKLMFASKEKERIDLLQKETEATANDAINLLEKKNSRITNLLEKNEELESSKSAFIAKLEVENNCLATSIKAKTNEVKQFEEKVSALNRAVTTSHNKIERCEKKLTAEKEKYQEQIEELENAHQNARARLFGCEKLAIIHDKECTRLLNDIESKSELIHSLAQKVESLEANQEELYANTNEMEGVVATQRDIISTLEEELLEKSELSALEEDQDDHYYGDSKDPKERLRSLELKVEDRETELEILLDENKDISGKLADAEFKLEASEEEVQLLCESIEEKEHEINQLYESIEQVKLEKTEAVSLLSDMQKRAEQQKRVSIKIPSQYLHADDDDGDSLGISRPSLSPTASEIIHKHSELLDDLVKMKSAIHEAMSPSMNVDDELSSSDGSISAVKLLQQELEEKNRLLSNMSNQVDSLMHDVNEAKAALSDKDASVQELRTSLQELEGGQLELKKKLKSRKAYIKQLEDALSHEVRHRRDMENTLFSAQKEKKALAVDYQSKTKELESAQKEIKEKEYAVAEQMNVARNLAKQLHTTKGKISALKQHLQQEGLLKDGHLPPKAPIPYQSPSVKHSESNKGQHHIPDINATLSNDSMNWSISDDESS